jgi:hypothetical protein
MKWHIPHPLGLAPKRIEVMAANPVIPPGLAEGTDAAHVCRSVYERGAVATDLATLRDSRWVAYAVQAAMRGHLPRTKVYLTPTLSGANGIDLGRGPLSIPMAFGGATCLPEEDGHLCDHPDVARLPEHEALVQYRRLVVEDAGDVVFDDFEDGLAWPMVVVEGGEA